MASLDDDRLDLLERRLADQVTERVRPALFRVYALIGAAVLGALGYAGWDFMEDTKQEVRAEARARVQSEIDAATKDIEEARRDLGRRVGAMEELQERAGRLLNEIDGLLRNFAPKAQQLEDLTRKVDDLERRRKEIEDSLERTRGTANANAGIAEQVQVLAEQIKRINEQLSSMTAAAVPDAAPAAPQSYQSDDVAQKVSEVIGSAQAAQSKLAEYRARPTVYVQFAVAPRQQAQDFAKALEAKGYVVPAPDREDTARGKHEVRYFYAEDEATAGRVAADVTEVLASLGFAGLPPVQPVSLTGFRGPKPRSGVVELWLELPARQG